MAVMLTAAGGVGYFFGKMCSVILASDRTNWENGRKAKDKHS